MPKPLSRLAAAVQLECTYENETVYFAPGLPWEPWASAAHCWPVIEYLISRGDEVSFGDYGIAINGIHEGEDFDCIVDYAFEHYVQEVE